MTDKTQSRTELQAFAIKDIQSQLFSQPHFATNAIVAKRGFKAACENPESNFNKYPEDFSLYHVGSYNIETGFLQTNQLIQIDNATAYVKNNK